MPIGRAVRTIGESQAAFTIEANRIHVTGLSMGCIRRWEIIRRSTAMKRIAELFAANGCGDG